MAIQAIRSSEPIPGYKIMERIGAGGYGEVWKAIAPGGLEKAVKFVYGYFSDDRASRELKALNRIKEVRHPFLISLERIEIVDGQLLIVTELADATLSEVCKQYTDKGQPGIPREELLVYLGDAADALDFMCERFSLQHLDVKPENLLLVGGRIKVADFGLVKHLQDVTASLMGGLTPLYASPEVFDGQPCLQSDQYSLAIVYQEMLTGSMPFPGTTAAQLATQHLQSRPQLSSLPSRDQPILARSLAKDPEQRYSSCREMIDHLLGRVTSAPAAAELPASAKVDSRRSPVRGSVTSHVTDIVQPRGANALAAPKPAADQIPTGPFHSPSMDAAPQHIAGRKLPQLNDAPQVESLPPVEFDTANARLRPTVFVGIGGTAVRVLTALGRRLENRFGRRSTFPAFQMLLLDTDVKALMNHARGERSEDDETVGFLGVPLRRPQDYRNRSRRLLESMSRRWLYNIPKSLQTEGLRPLGRLAFLDHAHEINDRIEQAIRDASAPDAVATSIETTESDFFSDRVRVVIVASICGGVGSGMVVDVAFSARKALTKLGLPCDQLYGVLTHSTGRNAAAKDLSVVNAFACLSELQHFSQPDQHYPGDAGSGLPAQENGIRPFDNTYLVHLGNDLADDEFQAATEAMADYLFLDAATECGTVLEQCRETARSASKTEDRGMLMLRSFGLCRIGCSEHDLHAATESLCRRVFESWLGDSSSSRSFASSPNALVETAVAGKSDTTTQVEIQCVRLADELNLNVDSLATAAREVLFEQLGGDAPQCIQTMYARLAADGASQENPVTSTQFLPSIENLLGPCDHGDDPGAAALKPWQSALTKYIEQQSEEWAGTLHEWIVLLVDDSGVRLAGAKRAADWFIKHLREVVDETGKRRSSISTEIKRLGKTLAGELAIHPIEDLRSKPSNKRKGAPDPMESLHGYLQRRVDMIAADAAIRLARSICAACTKLGEQIADLQRNLRNLTGQFEELQLDIQEPASSDSPEAALSELRRALALKLNSRLPELAVELGRAFPREFFGAEGGLKNALGQNTDVPNDLVPALRTAARQAVHSVRAKLDVPSILAGLPEETAALWLRYLRDRATPRLLRSGGAKRLVSVVPSSGSLGQLEQMTQRLLKETPTIIPGSDGDVYLCYEAEQIPVSQVAARLIDGRPDLADVASRVQTRVDIKWAPWK